VLVSPFDLNVEEGKIEQPIKPTIRFATPVFDRKGHKRGMLILNYLGSNLLDRFRPSNENSTGRIMLLNRNGYWLHTANPADQWGFMSLRLRNRTFGRRYPEVWRKIAHQDSGQLETPEGLFTFQTVYPVMSLPNALMPVRRNYYWKVVALVPPPLLAAETRQLWFGFVQVLLLLMVVLAGGSALAAKIITEHGCFLAFEKKTGRRVIPKSFNLAFENLFAQFVFTVHGVVCQIA
jgi:hypothetical protein